jgi:hypothetical protein
VFRVFGFHPKVPLDQRLVRDVRFLSVVRLHA